MKWFVNFALVWLSRLSKISIFGQLQGEVDEQIVNFFPGKPFKENSWFGEERIVLYKILLVYSKEYSDQPADLLWQWKSHIVKLLKIRCKIA